MFRGSIDLDAAFERFHGPAATINLPKPSTILTPQTSIGDAAFDNDPSTMDWQYDPSGFQNFCESKDHMNLRPRDWKEGDEGALSARQLSDCLAILGNDPKNIFNPAARKYTFGGLLWAKGSGKDYVCALIHAYLTHILLCMKNPQDFFGFGAGEPCDILNVGQKGTQAERVYFKKFKTRILNWPWMFDKYKVVDGGKRVGARAKGYPVCDIGKRSVVWEDKGIRCFTENSGNPESLEGYNIVFYICDEISGWVSEKDREVAAQILKILRTSQGSRNTKSLSGIGMAISYPRQDDDIMFEIEKESFAPNSSVFFSRAYQWEAKPKRTYEGTTFRFNAGTEALPEWFDIPTELNESFFTKYPEQAKCVYLLKPPPVGGQFFEFIEKMDAIARTDRQPLFKVATELIDSSDGEGKKLQYIRKRILGLNGMPQRGVDYVIWLDAAETTCDASLSIGHTELVTLIEGTERRETTVVVLDDTIVWEPDPDKRIIVDIASMTQCVLDMRKYITIKAAWWDQWNSGTGMKDFRDAGIMCDKHNLRFEDYDFYKSLIYTSRFYGPQCPNVEKGIAQLKHLSRSRTNVIPGSSKHKKDISDTWCGVVTLLMGSLAQKNIRVGHAPSAITIMGATANSSTATTNTVSQATAARANNPFSAPMTGNSTQRIKDHSDMFRALNPASHSSGNNMGGSRTFSPRTTEQSGKSRFPRGVQL